MAQDTERQFSYSVIIPVRNEHANIPALVERLRASLPDDAEIIFVDDGSTDGTRALLAELSRDDERIVALRFRRAFGKSHALAAGFERCRGRIVATIDADLQEDPADVVRLAGSLRSDDEASAGRNGPNGAPRGLDLVGAWRRVRRDPPMKVFLSRVFNAVIRVLAGVKLRDINCGLKVMRREVMESLHLEGGYHRFIPLLAHWHGFEVGEVEIEHSPRRHGRSRFGTERLLHGAVDLLVLLFLERFDRRPSRLFLTSGLTLSAAGIGICAFITYLKVTTGTIQSRYPLLTLGVLLIVVGLQVISAGFLAELVVQGGRRRETHRVRAVEIPPAASSEGAGDTASGTESPERAESAR